MVSAEPTTPFTATAVFPSFTGLVAVDPLVPRLAQALSSVRVTGAVCEVTVTPPVTAGPPPACLTLTHTCSLITLGQVAVASDGTFQPPVAPVALTPACQLVAAGARRPRAAALARLGAGGRPPALVTGAVPVDGVAVAVPDALAGGLAERAPAVGVAGALSGDGVTAAVREALTHLATVRSPELTGTACFTVSSEVARGAATHSGIHTDLLLQTGLLTLTHR